MPIIRPARRLAGGMLALILTALLVGCAASSQGDEDLRFGTAYANLDPSNTRNAPGSLETATVSKLKLAWRHPLAARGEGLHYIGSPVVDEGVVFLQDPESNVEAIDLRSGELLWEKEFLDPSTGPFGVTVGQGLVFGSTTRTAFALDAETGEEIWSTTLTPGPETIKMTPGYHNRRVYIGTAPSFGKGGELGVLWALDAESGRKIWHFDNVPRSLWGHPEINYGGGIYSPPAFDGEGSMYVGISHAGPIPGTEKYPWGSSRPGPNLYSDSIVRLDEKTGEVEWYYQITPHGVCNGFLVSPVLAKAGGRKVVMGGGILGILVAVDQATGKLIWRKPVGVHNGHDNDGLLAMRGEYATLEEPLNVFPGIYGGIAAPMSVRGSTVFVPIVNGGTRVLSQTSTKPLGTPTGELVALDVGTGEIKWKHSFPSSLYGPTTVSNDLVFGSAFDGRLFALDAGTGDQAWLKDLSAITEGGMTVTEGTLLARAGAPSNEPAELLAFRVPD